MARYKDHPEIASLPDDLVIWRYMSLSKFCDLVFNDRLHFTRTSNFDDPWEGIPPKDIMFNLADPPELWYRHFHVREQTAVNCWHAAEHESMAMWKIYCPADGEGIVVKSNIAKLRSCFIEEVGGSATGEVVHIGRVEYSRPASEWDVRAEFLPILHKRVFFGYEQEVRAFIRPETDFLKRLLSHGIGVSVPVDVHQLIEEVRVSPLAPSWFLPVVVKLNTGLKIVPSDLAERPSQYS